MQHTTEPGSSPVQTLILSIGDQPAFITSLAQMVMLQPGNLTDKTLFSIATCKEWELGLAMVEPTDLLLPSD